jgi:hypothetical protein
MAGEGPALDGVGKRLRYARECRGLTLPVLLKYRVPRPSVATWRHYERGTRSIPLKEARWAAWALDVPASWVLMETHEAPCQPRAKPTTLERMLGVPAPGRVAENWLRARIRSGGR